MNKPIWAVKAFAFSTLALSLGACSTINLPSRSPSATSNTPTVTADYSSRIPQHIKPGAKTVVIDPNVHVWGAYDSSGNLVRSGLTTAGSSWCPDIHRACKTRSGTFHVQSLGAASCKSSIYPLPRGGAPMPYCMFFNGSQGMHGTYGNGVVEGNISHGCVRLHVSDAEWLRFNFVNVGTRVVVKPY
ncbi:MAG: L,D-transpeptidase family protein [Gammaproteobacteria bacterium]